MKISIFKLITIFTFTLVIFSCKKKSNSAPDVVNNTTSTTTNNYGVFLSRKSVIITNTLVSSQPNFSNAFVSNAALTNNSPNVGSLLDMGTVNLNGVVFQKNAWSVSGMYKDSTTTTYNTPHNWVISGSTAVPSFSFSNTNTYPIYTGYAAIADSFVVANNISIPLTNYSGADEIETYFVTSSNPTTNTSIQNVAGTVTSLNFTTTDLSIIGVNANVALVITFYKNNTQTINGKSYNFRTGYNIIKSNIKFK